MEGNGDADDAVWNAFGVILDIDSGTVGLSVKGS